MHSIPKTVRKIRKCKTKTSLEQNFSMRIKNQKEAAIKEMF